MKTSWRRPIFPGRYQPSIVGTAQLNFRVRNGNGWTLTVKNTNYLYLTRVKYFTIFRSPCQGGFSGRSCRSRPEMVHHQGLEPWTP